MKKHHTVSLTLLALVVLSVGLFSLYRNIGGGQLAEDFQFVTEPSPDLYPPRRFQTRQTRSSEASKTSAAPP